MSDMGVNILNPLKPTIYVLHSPLQYQESVTVHDGIFKLLTILKRCQDGHKHCAASFVFFFFPHSAPFSLFETVMRTG